MPYWNYLQYPARQVAGLPAAPFGGPHLVVARQPTMTAAALRVLVPDYLLTRAAARLERQPRRLPGLCFPLLRMLDAAISLYLVPAAWLSVSSGRWKSPARRPVGRAATALLPAAAGGPAGSPYRTGTSDEPGAPARVAEASHVSG